MHTSYLHTYRLINLYRKSFLLPILLLVLQSALARGQQSIQLTATNPDGTNTGTARLGIPVNLSATISAGPYQVVNFSVSGAGSVSGSSNTTGVYTPPLTMPSNSSVTITAYLHSQPSTSATYTLSLVNPVPTLTSTSVPQVLTGGTQTVYLTGTGFEPGMVLNVNGSSVATTYKDYHDAIVQLPVPATASGSLTLQPQNPAPGGGAGGNYSQAVAPNSISLTAKNSDGTPNDGTDPLSSSIQLTPVVNGSALRAVNWSVSGVGTVTSVGYYTAPAVMPSGGVATVIATLASNPAITASYPVQLVNPDPTINSASPLGAPAGTTTAIALSGTGFVPGVVVSVNGSPVSTTYQSPTSIIAQVKPAAGSTANLSLVAQNPAPGGGASASFTLPSYAIGITASDPDGNNTGTADLGVPVNLAAALSAGTSHYVSWSLQGAGTLGNLSGTYNNNAVYTPPLSMPSNSTVTITAYASSNTAVTTSYTLSLTNPNPVVSSFTPTQLLAGGTQTVSLTGSGFVSGMVVMYNGTALPATVSSYTKASVQVPVPANASNSLTLEVVNPAPGGGAGSTFTIGLPASSMSITATDQDGVNTGTAELGITVSLTANITGVANPAVNWSLSGAGSLANGIYTAPSTLPSNTSVTITATLTSNPSVTASYQFNLINPSPVISSVSPTQVPAGATTPVTLTGSGFLPGTTILLNNAAVAATYQSPTAMLVSVSPPAGSTSNISVVAQNAAPGGGSSAAVALPTWSVQLTATDIDGTNTGTARLGIPLTFNAVASAGSNHYLSYSLQGAGSINSLNAPYNGSEKYNPPLAMPSNPTVTVTAFASAYPSVTTSYTFTLVNPAPTITAFTPTQVNTGATQIVYLSGSGFVPGMTIQFGGQVLQTTYVDYDHAQVMVPVAGNATGTLNLQAQNPAPGGGVGSSFSLTVPTNSITLTATGVDGVNTGLAALGNNVTMTAAVTGSAQTAVNWSVTGGGSIDGYGVYTAPSIMPSSSAVTITASLASNPAITASYSFSLVNPTPVVVSTTPAQIPAGATISLTLTGTGFVPGTVVTSGTGAVTNVSYVSPTSLTAQITLPANASGNVGIQAQNPAPGGGIGIALQVPVSTLQITATNPDGVNTGTARLGVPVTFSTAVNNSQYQVVGWSLQGAGSINWSGNVNQYATYTPPSSMPSSPTVTITAFMSSYPSLATTYTLTLINPVPSVTSASPTQLLTGGTQTVTLAGSGFVPGTVILFNGQTLPVSYSDYNDATVQVPVSATATGNLSLQVKNPAPGGGTGNTFIETVQGNSIVLTATDEDGGVNTGTAELSSVVAVTATVNGSAQTAVTWTLTGSGSIDVNGNYTAPATLPTNTAVTITAALTSNPTITASYQLNIINPLATITGGSPSLAPAGETTPITFTGTGFVPGTVIHVNGTAVPTTYHSSTSVVASITVSASLTGNLQITAVNPSPGGGTSLFYLEAISASLGTRAAARILDQTTFGPTTALISQVQQIGIDAWLSQQFNTPQTVMPTVYTTHPSYCQDSEYCTESEWWQTVLTGNDQLRQRVAFALSQLFVANSQQVTGAGINPYINMLAADAFTNWYQILTDVTLSPAMGISLDMLNSRRATGGQIADENYAREVMQLFDTGLFLLNQDGTYQLDGNGNPIPTYTQAQVQAFARAFTGWTYANADGSTPSTMIGTPNYLHPLVAIENWHDENPKSLLDDANPTDYVNGTVTPANQTAEQDMAAALTNIFNHPNVPPFVSKQLIQHLVTSSPSPDYISRVAAVFTNDGNGVRGNMTAVLTAIFTDPEARAGDTDSSADVGHLREPVLWMTAVMRGLGYVNVDPNNYYNRLSVSYMNTLNEIPFESPSVFNFFPPDYVIPGTNLLAPEFGIENTASVALRLTLADNLVANRILGFNVDLSATSPLGQQAVSSPANLVATLNTLFMHAEMDPNIQAAILNEITPIKDPAQQVRLATYLVITSSQYKVSH